MNKQPAEPVMRIPEGAVQVVNIFDTIQGEGPFAGTPAVFIRLAGCNLQCPWCDTDYTSRRELLLPSAVVAAVSDLRPVLPLKPLSDAPQVAQARPLVVVTGGEPFRQTLGPLVRALYATGYRVQVETNGTLSDPAFPWELATIVCSPKSGRLNSMIEPHIAALKYVLDHRFISGEDGLPLSTMGAGNSIARPSLNFTGEIYVQPLDESGNGSPADFVTNDANRLNLEAAVKSSMTYGYRLCIQTHKLTGLE